VTLKRLKQGVYSRRRRVKKVPLRVALRKGRPVRKKAKGRNGARIGALPFSHFPLSQSEESEEDGVADSTDL